MGSTSSDYDYSKNDIEVVDGGRRADNSLSIDLRPDPAHAKKTRRLTRTTDYHRQIFSGEIQTC